MDWMDKVFTVWKALISVGFIGLFAGLIMGSAFVVEIFAIGLFFLVIIWLALLFIFF